MENVSQKFNIMRSVITINDCCASLFEYTFNKVLNYIFCTIPGPLLEEAKISFL